MTNAIKISSSKKAERPSISTQEKTNNIDDIKISEILSPVKSNSLDNNKLKQIADKFELDTVNQDLNEIIEQIQTIAKVAIRHGWIQSDGFTTIKDLENNLVCVNDIKRKNYITVWAEIARSAGKKVPENLEQGFYPEKLDKKLGEWIEKEKISIHKLDLSFKKLDFLPKSIGKLKSLRDLNLKMNNITYLPESIKDLDQNLENIKLDLDKIKNLPDLIVAILFKTPLTNGLRPDELFEYALKNNNFYIIDKFIQSPKYSGEGILKKCSNADADMKKYIFKNIIFEDNMNDTLDKYLEAIYSNSRKLLI